MDHTERHDRNPAIAELLGDAFVAPVDVDTASRHLWVIHSEAAKLAEAQAVEAEAEVVAEADALLAAQPFRGSLARRGLPRAAVPVLALMILMSFSGVAVAASHNSLPGDALYMVKRGTERAQLIFVRDPVTRAELQLSFARTRLAEIERIATTRPQHVANLVAEIAVTLDEVDKSPPEVAERVQPVTDSIRRETTQSIAVLDLPSDYNDAVAVAMTATATPTASTTTPVPATGSPSATPLDNLTPVASVEPKDTDGDGIPDTPASAVPNPTAQPEPVPGEETDGVDGSEEPQDGASADPSAEPTATPSASPSPSPSPSTSEPSESGSEAPGASPSAGPSTQPSSSPSSTPSGGPSSQPSDGPVVTPRPQASEVDDSGQSRSDDEDGTDDGSSESSPQPGPSSRPGNAPSDPEPASSEPAPEASGPAPDEASAPTAAPESIARPAVARPGDVAQ